MIGAGQQFGRYEILDKIGEGGMGQVYSARDLELDRSVAIKVLPAEFSDDEERRTRFRLEARVVSALNHPNVITIYEIGENDLGHFLATEFVEGRTLREMIKVESLTMTRILRIMEQAANALVAAHAERIVHRDIKPENIMVRRDGIVKVLDFGLAKPVVGLRSIDNSDENKTVPGTVMGSARYMSPEQARGLEVDERTDIWSLGVVLYELVVGKAPFDGETAADTLAAVIYHEPESIANILPNAPFELQRIIRKALQKDREERYQSVKDLALDLKELLHEIEHANSGNRTASGNNVISNPEFSENPTIIHRTASGNHQTDRTTIMTSAVSASKPARRRFDPVLIAAAVLILVLAAGGFAAFYAWNGGTEPLAAASFIRPQISRVNTDGKVFSPAISPDGKYVAYVSGDQGNRSLLVRQIATDSAVPIVPPTNLNLQAVTFSPTGDYVYYCQTSPDNSVNTLYQVPALGGTPKKLIEDVDGTITFSPDGKQFAFVRHTSATNEDIVIVADAQNLQTRELVRSGSTGFDFFSFKPAWSPDGREILLGGGHRQGGVVTKMAVVAADVVEGRVRTLNDGRFFMVGNFAWFADGSGFVFAGRETQTSPVQVWRASVPDLEIEQLTNDFNDYTDVGISSDGRTIVTLKVETTSSLWETTPGAKVARQLTTDNRNLEGKWGLHSRKDGTIVYTRNEGKRSEIWTADADGKNAKAVFTSDTTPAHPAPSHDGKYIVFSLVTEKAAQIWRINADGSNPVLLTNADSQFGDYNPEVTADGSTVIFHRLLPNGDRIALMKVPINGGDAETLYVDDTWSAFMPRLSPDGKFVAFTTYNIHTWVKKIRIASLDGNKLGEIVRDIDYTLIGEVEWSPDSRSLTVSSSRSGASNVWKIPVDGSAPTQLTDLNAGSILNFAWSADGRRMYLLRGNSNNDLIIIRDTAREAVAKKIAPEYGRPRLGLFGLVRYFTH